MRNSKIFMAFTVLAIGMLLCLSPGLATATKVAMVLPGNISDKSWNQAGYEGLMRLKNELGMEVAYSEKVPQPDQAEALADYARRGYDYIIGHGGEFQQSALQVARKYPENIFIVHNGVTAKTNVATLGLNLKQIGYLMGYLSGKMTQSGKIGYIGAQKVKNYVTLGQAYKVGFKAALPSGKYFSAWTNDWDDIAKGKEAALSQISQGADVVFPTMDNAVIGSLQAAKEKGVWGIGIYYDALPDWPNTVLQSAVANYRQAIVEMFKPVKSGQKIEGKAYVYGLEHPEVLNIGSFHPKVPQGVRDEVVSLREKIKTGDLKF